MSRISSMQNAKHAARGAGPSAAVENPPAQAGSVVDEHRDALFVGRAAELELFDDLLADFGGPCVLAVTGVGGIGKSTLVHAWERRARGTGVDWVGLDGNTLMPNPTAFQARIPERFHTGPAEGSARVIAVDAFEKLLPLEGWLRRHFLPQLPPGTILILAGRWTPGVAWRADPGIARTLTELNLEALAVEEASDYLERREIPEAYRATIEDFARGHPLTLALAADRIERDPDSGFSVESSPDLIHALVDWLLDDVARDRRRPLLEACALVRHMTEPLLAAMLETTKTSEAFDWLAQQHYMALQPQGLAMHDLVREPIARELRWRDPVRYRTMARRACHHYIDEIDSGSVESGVAAIAACLYVMRLEPFVQHHFSPDNVEYFIDTCRAGELPRLAEMVAAYEGTEAAERFLRHAHEDPASVIVVRDRALEPRGVSLVLTFDAEGIAAGRDDDDPGIAAFCRYVHDHAPPRGDRTVKFMRFAIDRDTFQGDSPVYTHLATYSNGLYCTPGLSFFASAADTAYDWWGTGEFGDVPLIPGTEFESGGRRFMLMAHDMRSESPVQWARNSVDRILGERPPASGTASPRRLLSRSEFEDAVHDALRHFHDDEALRKSLLHESLLMSARATDPESLRELLAETSREILDDGTSRSAYRVLVSAHFDRAAHKQSAAADALSMSERTFRRRLRQAEAQLVERLWQRETRRG